MNSTVQVYEAIITDRQGAVTGNPAEGDPAVITYDAMAVNTPDQVYVRGHKPKRRISAGAKVLVAEVNDPCRIVIVNGVHYLHVNEGIPFAEACP